MGLTVGEEDHADVGAAGATGIATRGIARASTGTSGVKSGEDGAINCWSSSLVNKGTSTQGPQWSGGEGHGVLCCDKVEVGAIGVVQRLFLAQGVADEEALLALREQARLGHASLCPACYRFCY